MIQKLITLSLLLTGLTLWSCARVSGITKEEYIENNKDIDVNEWDGWWIAHKPGSSYYMAKYPTDNNALPHFIFFRHKESIIVRFLYNEELLTSPIDDLGNNPFWNQKHQHIDIHDLKEKVEWVFLNDVDYVKFDRDTLFVKTISFAVKKGAENTDSYLPYGWEDWPKGKCVNK